jgi:Dyp-type peroxidase family
MTSGSTPAIDWTDVQGMVLRGYGKHPYGANLFLKIDDAAAARTWLAALSGRITTGDRAVERAAELFLNVAFTRTGLSKLGLSQKIMDTFPTAFYEGAGSDNRARILGDAGDSDPKKWAWGGQNNCVDAILMIYTQQAAVLDTAMGAEKAALKGISLAFEPPINTLLAADQKEHFGFHDGISEPIISGSPPSRHSVSAPQTDFAAANVIKAGEFLLGYANEYDVLPDAPVLPGDADAQGILPKHKTLDGHEAPDLGLNGTYLVVRQIEQDVARFWTYLDDASKDAQGRSCPSERDRLAAKLIGRWPSGAPVTVARVQDDPSKANFNDFLYCTDDADGSGCPFGAHVRRGLPRDTLGSNPAQALNLTKRHRLIRRGRSYGPDLANVLDRSDTQKRGLVFMCINANIERQFEFVQQTWINNPSFNGMYEEKDPVFGTMGPNADGIMTIPQKPVRRRLSGLGGFVTVRGGAYFFMPSIRALRYLAMMA